MTGNKMDDETKYSARVPGYLARFTPDEHEEQGDGQWAPPVIAIREDRRSIGRGWETRNIATLQPLPTNASTPVSLGTDQYLREACLGGFEWAWTGSIRRPGCARGGRDGIVPQTPVNPLNKSPPGQSSVSGAKASLSACVSSPWVRSACGRGWA